MVSVKMDSRMKAALKKLAERQVIPISAVIKQAIQEHLQRHEIEWRDEISPEDPPKK